MWDRGSSTRSEAVILHVFPGGPGYPVSYSQAAYDGGQAAYPIQPPVQPGFAHPPPPTDYSSTQPAYNPAYMEQPKTGY